MSVRLKRLLVATFAIGLIGCNGGQNQQKEQRKETKEESAGKMEADQEGAEER